MRALAVAAVLTLLAGAAPGADAPLTAGEAVTRVRATVAEILGRKSPDIDVAAALSAQGADELDIVEIIMALEEAFDVQIPDESVDGAGHNWQTLNVQRLAQIVRQLKRTAPPRL